MTNERRRRVRIRNITDEAKYRRHVRRKLLRRVVRATAWILGGVIVVALFWLILDKMAQPRADD